MFFRFSFALLVIALAALPAKAQIRLSPAYAPVVLLDQPPDPLKGVISDASCDICRCSANVLADNFVQVLPVAPTGITEIIIWGGWFPFNTQTTDDWTVIIHTDAGGLPGGVFYTQANFAASSIVATGVVFLGVLDEYMVTLDISPDLVTPPGTYWAEIYHDSGCGGTDDWIWERGTLDAVSGIPGYGFADAAPGVIWFPGEGDRAIKINGDDTLPVSVTVETPGTHQLSNAYPNPFNPQSQFTLAVAHEQHVLAEMYNTLGQRVAVLFDSRVGANQSQLVTIDGATLSSGMYIVRVNGERFSDALRVTLLK